MSATVHAMKHLKIRSTVIATAYKESINQAGKKYYEDGGLEVLAIKGLEVSKPVDQVKLPDYASYKVARELYAQHSTTDSLLIQGRWRSVAYVQELEDDTQNLRYPALRRRSGGSCTFLESKSRSPASANFCAAKFTSPLNCPKFLAMSAQLRCSKWSHAHDLMDVPFIQFIGAQTRCRIRIGTGNFCRLSFGSGLDHIDAELSVGRRPGKKNP